MASPGSYIRSAARATFSAYRSVPIRWRLAGGSAALTFVILAGFATIVGVLINRQVRLQFDDQQNSNFSQLYSDLDHKLTQSGLTLDCNNARVHLGDIGSVAYIGDLLALIGHVLRESDAHEMPVAVQDQYSFSGHGLTRGDLEGREHMRQGMIGAGNRSGIGAAALAAPVRAGGDDHAVGAVA